MASRWGQEGKGNRGQPTWFSFRRRPTPTCLPQVKWLVKIILMIMVWNYRVRGENGQSEIIALAYRFAENMVRVHRFHACFLIEARRVGEAA